MRGLDTIYELPLQIHELANSSGDAVAQIQFGKLFAGKDGPGALAIYTGADIDFAIELILPDKISADYAFRLRARRESTFRLISRSCMPCSTRASSGSVRTT